MDPNMNDLNVNDPNVDDPNEINPDVIDQDMIDQHLNGSAINDPKNWLVGGELEDEDPILDGSNIGNWPSYDPRNFGNFRLSDPVRVRHSPGSNYRHFQLTGSMHQNRPIVGDFCDGCSNPYYTFVDYYDLAPRDNRAPHPAVRVIGTEDPNILLRNILHNPNPGLPEENARNKRPAAESGSGDQSVNKQPRTTSLTGDGAVPGRAPRVPAAQRTRIIFHR